MKKKSIDKIPLRVLCLEDSPRVIEIIRELLIDAGYDLSMDYTDEEKKFASLLRRNTYDVILSDFNLPGFNAFESLRLAVDICPEVPFICVSGSIGEETAIEIIRQGAVDYILKDRMLKLPSAIKRVMDEAKEKNARRRAEESLRESEERYRALVTFSPDPLYVHVDGHVTLVNPAICQLLGAEDPSQLVGKSVFEIVHPDYHEKVRERWNIVFSGQPAPLLEEKFIRLDGTLVDVEVNAVAIDWKGSKEVHIIARDITKRKRTEEALIASESRYRRLFETAKDGILILDANTGMIVDVNPFLIEMLGYSHTQFQGKTIWEHRIKKIYTLLLKWKWIILNIATRATVLAISQGRVLHRLAVAVPINSVRRKPASLKILRCFFITPER
jgi:PAS domain S-box-containing protein